MKNQPKTVASLVKKALALLSGASSFSISTRIPKEWLAAEESDFDRKLIGAESVKSSLNKKISSSLAKSSGIPYDAEGDIRIVFDFTGEEAAVSTERIPLFVFGRYKKLVPGLSQSRWICSDCAGKGCAKCNGRGKHYDSVEERIGDAMKRHFAAEDYTMHASGREDVDATNTAGRPFVMEVKNPSKRKTDPGSLESEIASGKEVAVTSLRMVPRTFVELVTESHFDKEYEAEVEFGRAVGEGEIKKLEALAGKMLEQQTPERVAHRRADLVRKRKVIELALVGKADEKHAVFRIKAEAGTYIKELVSGDNGRTVPSFAGVLGFEAKCTRLAVTKIEDGFLDTCLP
jgi:tRNA pseudouridine synthase 10